MNATFLGLAASHLALAAASTFGHQLQSLATAISQGMLGSLVAGSLLALLAAAALRLMNHQNSRTRYAVCLSTLLALAALPLAASFSNVAPTAPSSDSAVIRLPESWAIYLFVVWALVTCVALARIMAGLIRLFHVRRDCVPVPLFAIDAQLQRTLTDFQTTRHVTLCTSDTLCVPTAIGLWKAAIALPAWCLRDLSADELHTVVLHELEHLRRYDDWTNLLQQIIAAIFFFHPAVWWLENRLSLEREMACDDAVLSRVPDPRGYAKCLVTLAEKSIVRRGLALAQAAVSRVQQLSVRIARILDARRSQSTRLWVPALSLVAVASVAGSVSIAWMPRLVTFQPSPALLANAVAPGAIDRAFVPTAISETSAAVPATPTRWSSDAVCQEHPSRPTSDALRAKHAPAPSAHSQFAQAALQNAAARENKGDSNADQNEENSPAVTARSSSFSSDGVTELTWTEVNLHQVSSSAMLVMVVETEQQEVAGAVWRVQVTRWMLVPAQPRTRSLDPIAPSKT
jgi:beta-lactamase regulating signal transducer with metallopeptidase domain